MGIWILLEKDGKKLYIKIDSPVPVRIKSWPAQSENAFDSPNPGALIVGFEADLEVNTEHNFNIYLMPKEERSVK